MKTKTSLTRKSMSRSPVPLALLLIPLALAWFALAPQADATCREGCLTLNNTVLGDDALVNNVSGGNNTALGDSALSQNTFGVDNTATGSAALFSNISGGGNTANGDDALAFNTTGSNNTAVGSFALYLNTGSSNTAIGEEALNNNTTAIQNTAVGRSALDANTTGSNNTAVGFKALDGNTNGSSNTAIGINALLNSTIGSSNIALGNGAGRRLTIGDNNIDIGNEGVHAEANTIRIGKVGTQTATFIAGISGTTVVGDTVVVDSNGQLGTVASAARFKKDIQPMDKASEAILGLKPVTFRYKQELDPEGIPQFGLVAEQVEKVNPDLVARDKSGKPYSVRYEAVNAMLLNEFLKEHQTVQELKKQVAELTAGLQKLSAQLELSKPAPQTVMNDQ